MWNLKSKGDKSLSTYIIGTELVKLYKNYVSEFEFDISNIKDDALDRLNQGLNDECLKKTYIKNDDVTDNGINVFLYNVYFAINNKEKSNYIKKL